jgi:hypothetical protein
LINDFETFNAAIAQWGAGQDPLPGIETLLNTCGIQYDTNKSNAIKPPMPPQTTTMSSTTITDPKHRSRSNFPVPVAPAMVPLGPSLLPPPPPPKQLQVPTLIDLTTATATDTTISSSTTTTLRRDVPESEQTKRARMTLQTLTNQVKTLVEQINKEKDTLRTLQGRITGLEGQLVEVTANQAQAESAHKRLYELDIAAAAAAAEKAKADAAAAAEKAKTAAAAAQLNKRSSPGESHVKTPTAQEIAPKNQKVDKFALICKRITAPEHAAINNVPAVMKWINATFPSIKLPQAIDDQVAWVVEIKKRLSINDGITPSTPTSTPTHLDMLINELATEDKDDTIAMIKDSMRSIPDFKSVVEWFVNAHHLTDAELSQLYMDFKAQYIA